MAIDKILAKYSSLHNFLIALEGPIWLQFLQFIGVVFSSAVALYALWALYAITAHPLARFPGPKLAAISSFYYSNMAFSGKLPMRVAALHEKYGPVVRIAPAELSFASVASPRDIYGPTGANTFVKSEFYKTSAFEASDIIGESDVGVHAKMRKMWAHGFSARALREHEQLEDRYVDLLIRQFSNFGQQAEGINVVDWFNFLTFDIIGELVFGESFGALESGTSKFWISLLLENMHGGMIIDQIRRWGFYVGFKKILGLIPSEKIKQMNQHVDLTRKLAAKRLSRGKDEKKDFLSYMFDNEGRNSISVEEVASQGQNLIIAGSETTATTLSAITYYLLKNPEHYLKLKTEIRSQILRYEDITSSKVASFPFLHAVINEALRLYPPVPYGPPRLSPGAHVDGHYIPKGIEVSVNPWAIQRNPKYWRHANTFDPNRWIDENSTDNREASQPFHLGPRVCLGRNLAFIEMRLVLAKMHYKFDLELVNEDVVLERDAEMYILWNTPAINVRFKERLLEG